MGFSWEIQVGAGILLVLSMLIALISRRPARSTPRSAHEWMVLRDRIQELESRVRALEQTPGQTTVTPAPQALPAVPVPVPGRAGTRPSPGSTPKPPSEPAEPTAAPVSLPQPTVALSGAAKDHKSSRSATLAPLVTLITVPDIGRHHQTSAPQSAPIADSGPPSMDEFGPQYEKVCDMAGKGIGPAIIAQALSLPQERVEMILGLYQLWAHPGKEPDPDMVHPVQAID